MNLGNLHTVLCKNNMKLGHSRKPLFQWPRTLSITSNEFVGQDHRQGVYPDGVPQQNIEWLYNIVLGGSSHLVSGLVHPSYKWTTCPHKNHIEITRVGSPTYDSWDEPPSKPKNKPSPSHHHLQMGGIFTIPKMGRLVRHGGNVHVRKTRTSFSETSCVPV